MISSTNADFIRIYSEIPEKITGADFGVTGQQEGNKTRVLFCENDDAKMDVYVPQANISGGGVANATRRSR